MTEQLTTSNDVSPAAIAERADRLAEQAQQLRLLSDKLQESQAIRALSKLLAEPDEATDLLAGCLWVARLDDDEIDIDAYRSVVDRMADEIKAGLPSDADEAARLKALNKFFFDESGFHGNRRTYYKRANSHINEVLDDREGLPITLSVIYMELARRLGLTVEGVGLPGHFVVRYRPATGDARLIDVYDSGVEASSKEADERVLEATGTPISEEQRRAMTKRAIVVRVLHNLINVAQRERDERGALRYLDALLALSPSAHRERFVRAMLRWQSGEHEGAKQDADFLLEHEPQDIELDRLRGFRAILERGGK